jgi:hypothetical protein
MKGIPVKKFLGIIALTLAGILSLANPVSASPAVHPRIPIGAFHIWAENGAQMCVGAQVISPGNPVLQRSNHANCFNMYDTSLGTDVNGWPKYYWEFGPSGYYMAATNDCTKVTIKQDAVSNGVVWILHADSNGNLKLFPQFCNSSGTYILAMSGNDTAGDQWRVSTGGFQALVFHQEN